jgi:deoxyribodipyrimidine photo-lyase
MSMPDTFTVFWFRRDLRLEDNAGLFHALQSGYPVIPLFIFDKEILDKLPKDDKRVLFIHQRLSALQEKLRRAGSSLIVRYGEPETIWRSLCDEFSIQAVYTNHDYEPYARSRDKRIAALLETNAIGFHTFKDQVIFEKNEILSGAGTPYTVFTPYSRKWRERFDPAVSKAWPSASLSESFFRAQPQQILSLESMGFADGAFPFPSETPDPEIVRHYDKTRDFPAMDGTSRMGIHLRFGTISIRDLVSRAWQLNSTYLNELIWREFYMQILWNFPHVAESAFRPAYDHIPWRNDEAEFRKWCNGKTGYPIVDAGMRELNETGYMHNRVRMITASFLTKHLLIDWRWGEAWFAEKLLDFELSSNNGGWQWAAGSGCDAAPYFRVFNPELQMKKFDPKLKYVRHWVPEFGTPLYPAPMVEHKHARDRAIATYKGALARE